MIPIRYHLITVAAVFLALGIGITLGGMAGQSWFAAQERQLLASLEAKYDRALKSNNELRQQVQSLRKQVEANNGEVIRLIAARYASDLQGARLYVWTADEKQHADVSRVLAAVGVELVPVPPVDRRVEGPLLLVGAELPSWANRLPARVKRLHVLGPPRSVEQQCRFLEDVQALVREERWEREKS